MSIKVTGPLGLLYLARAGRETVYFQVTSESTSVPASLEVRFPTSTEFFPLAKSSQGAAYAGSLNGRSLMLIDSVWRVLVAGPEHANGDVSGSTPPVLMDAGKPAFRYDTGTETLIVESSKIYLAEVSS